MGKEGVRTACGQCGGRRYESESREGVEGDRTRPGAGGWL